MNPAKSFPIEQSYINLAIVKAKDQYEKEKQLGNAGHNNDIMGSFEEIYGMKTAIDVKNIFDTLKNEEKQVLVFGRAGIGKSTFCRYVAYQWATGSYWSQYKLLALIPLRRLTPNRYPILPPGQNYSLIDLIKKEVFPYDLSENDERLLKKQFDAKKTLWILDGYDEIIQNVPPHLECLFEQLLKTPHHILTSRPYSNALSYNVQMEITGFTDENIEEYMQQFFNQMKDELDNATIKSQTLLKFLKSNRSIWGVAHIPVNLELICSLWSNEDWSETTHLTITTLYSMMIECLCRRYLRTQDNQILQLSEDEIDQCCQKELAFLASLAFNAMENNTIIIRPSSLKKALKEAQVSLKEHPHILNIGILKSFNKQGIGNQIQMNKDHYFVHLSFQEYFAARYLTSALKGCSPEKAIEFIKHQKYNQRYALVFSFASGILSKNDTEFGIHIFWNTILGEPLDLVGVRHIQLVISCFEATSDKSTLPRRTQLLQWIGNCIQYNVSNGNEIILKHLSQSLERAQSVLCDPTILNVLINLLQCNETDTKAKVFSFLSELEISNPSIALINSIVTTLTDKNDKVRVSACEVLGMMGEKAATNEMISRLVTALGDQSEYVRSKASCALGHMGEKAATNEVISKLISALGDESEDVRWSACEALGMMGEKAGTNEVIGKLVIALGHEREYVRASACEALGKMGEKAGTNEVIAKLVSALGDESRDVRWSACEALGRMGEKAGTNEVIDKLVIALGHEREYVRASACEALGKMGAKAGTNEVIAKLVSALRDESRDVRWSACETLGKMGEKVGTNEVIDKLVSALGDENREVRWSACKALGMMGEKAATNEVIGKLVSALGDENREVRWSACEALGMMGEKAATNEMISRLVSALGDQSEDVRSKASCALGHMGEKAATKEVISKLISALGDESEDVRRSACVALGDMGEKATTNEVISNLVSALEDGSRYVRMNACYALGRMGEKAATNEVISNLVSALEHESRYVRMNACYALGRMGEKAATNEVISKLVSELEDESEDVRMNACDALGNMGEKVATNEVISKLVSALGDESEGVRMNAGDALGTMGKEAATNEMISRLVSALGDENVYVRGSACEALGKMGEKAATNDVISRLVSALEDESHYVIRSACYALGKMGEKVATNEVISKLTSISNSDDSCSFYTAANAVENILSSSAVVTQLDPNIISYFCLSKNGSISLKNVSVDELMNVFLATKNPDWLPVLIQFTLLEGAAVTVTGDKVIVYGSKESSNLLVPSSRLRHQLIKAFTDQAKRLHLYFEVLFKDEVKLKG
jgi:HEAT repeat protein